MDSHTLGVRENSTRSLPVTKIKMQDNAQNIPPDSIYEDETKKCSTKHPVVGVGVLVLKTIDGKQHALVGKRLSHPGTGKYEFPGGFIDHMESFEESAKREVFEETGVTIKNVRFLRILSMRDYSPMHFIDVGLVAEWDDGNPTDKEPDSSQGWDWYDMDNMPEPLFISKLGLVEAYKNNISFMDL